MIWNDILDIVPKHSSASMQSEYYFHAVVPGEGGLRFQLVQRWRFAAWTLWLEFHGKGDGGGIKWQKYHPKTGWRLLLHLVVVTTRHTGLDSGETLVHMTGLLGVATGCGRTDVMRPIYHGRLETQTMEKIVPLLRRYSGHQPRWKVEPAWAPLHDDIFAKRKVSFCTTTV